MRWKGPLCPAKKWLGGMACWPGWHLLIEDIPGVGKKNKGDVVTRDCGFAHLALAYRPHSIHERLVARRYSGQL
jgi:hypothetical protein